MRDPLHGAGTHRLFWRILRARRDDSGAAGIANSLQPIVVAKLFVDVFQMLANCARACASRMSDRGRRHTGREQCERFELGRGEVYVANDPGRRLSRSRHGAMEREEDRLHCYCEIEICERKCRSSPSEYIPAAVAR